MHRTMQNKARVLMTLLLALAATSADAQPATNEGLVRVTEPWLLESWGFSPDAGNVFATPEALARLAMTPAEVAATQRAALERAAGPQPAAASSSFGTAVGRTTIDQASFRPVRSATDHQEAANETRVCLAGFPVFKGVFEGLPHGARLTAFQFWTFDLSVETISGAVFRSCPEDFGGPTTTLLGVYSSFGTGGFDTGVDFPSTTADDIDGRCTYSVRFQLDDSGTLCSEGEDLGIVAAQARWIREVSPAPVTATFDDVPTSHPFFQEIEALAAAGITDGVCDDPDKFCPGEVLTRAQIAALLARALGLHWP